MKRVGQRLESEEKSRTEARLRKREDSERDKTRKATQNGRLE